MNPLPYRFAPENIPQALRDRKQWIVWRFDANGQKKPINPHLLLSYGATVDSGWTEPYFWGTIDDAIAAREKLGPQQCGIGFVLQNAPAHDGFYLYGMDFDGPAKVPNPDARAIQMRIMEDLGSIGGTYFERSPSGQGFRAFALARYGEGRQQFNANANFGIEAYRGGRWITVTGDALSAQPVAILDEMIGMLWHRVGADIDIPEFDASLEQTTEWRRRLDLTDEQVIEQWMRNHSPSFNTCHTVNFAGDTSLAMRIAVGELDKISGDPNQVREIARRVPIAQKYQAGQGSNGFDRKFEKDWFPNSRKNNFSNRRYAWGMLEHGAELWEAMQPALAAERAKRQAVATVARNTATVADWFIWPDNEFVNKHIKQADKQQLKDAADLLSKGLHTLEEHVAPLLARAVELRFNDLDFAVLRESIMAAKVCAIASAEKVLRHLNGAYAQARHNTADQSNSRVATTMLRNGDGTLASNEANIAILLETHTEFKHLFTYDEFIGKILYTRQPPWPVQTAEFEEHHATSATILMQQFGMIYCKPDAVYKVIVRAAKENKMNSLRIAFDALEWDGVSRIDTWLTDYCHAEDTELNRAMGAKTLISGASRAYEPGSQVKAMLCLEGEQDVGKTKLLKTLVLLPRRCLSSRAAS
jgi:hypothetical protein